MAEGECYDDVTIGLQMQQFMDEWHYRVMQSNLAFTCDRDVCVVKAMDLFELAGLELSPDEKLILAEKDEYEMIACLVAKMPLSVRKNFEHFVLQLQLIVSSATRVRHALEGEDVREVSRVLEDGDAGISLRVLKEAVVEACNEVAELRALNSTWTKNMEQRITRLGRCQDEATEAAGHLAALESQLGCFGQEQNKKSTGVLKSLVSSQERGLMHTAFSCWMGQYMKYKAEEDIHGKFRRQIEDMEDALIRFKMKQVDGVKRVLARRCCADNTSLLAESIARWAKYAAMEREERDLEGLLTASRAKLEAYQEAQKESARRVMARLASGSEEALLSLCLQAWGQFLLDQTAEHAHNEEVRQIEQQLQAFVARKSEEAKGVLARLSGTTDSGLLSGTWRAWVEECRTSREERQQARMLEERTKKFKSLNARQKGAAWGTAARINEMLEENFLAQVYLAWACEARVDRIVRHYSGKMDNKKHQMESVQNMFKNFATQLERCNGSPRSTKHAAGRGAAEAALSPQRA